MATDGYLLDTSVASWLWDAGSPHHATTRTKFESLGDAPTFVSAITVGEVEYGLAVSPAIDPARQGLVRSAMASYQVLPIDRHTGETYGQIRAALFTQYSP